MSSDVSIELHKPVFPPTIDLFDALDTRRSRRDGVLLPLDIMASILWFVQRHTGSFKPSDRYSTPVATFGGLASVRTIVIPPSDRPWVYDPINHKGNYCLCSVEEVSQVRLSATEHFEYGDSNLLLYFANRDYVSKYYSEPDSLVLRESGGIQATTNLVAEAYQCSFCSLGSLGSDWVSTILNTKSDLLIPGGAAVIGYRG